MAIVAPPFRKLERMGVEETAYYKETPPHYPGPPFIIQPKEGQLLHVSAFYSNT